MSTGTREKRRSKKQNKKKFSHIVRTTKQLKRNNVAHKLRKSEFVVSSMVKQCTNIVKILENQLVILSHLILITMEKTAPDHPKKTLLKKVLFELDQEISACNKYLEKFKNLTAEEIDKTYIGTTIEGQNEFFTLAAFLTNIQVKMNELQKLHSDDEMKSFLENLQTNGIPEDIVSDIVKIHNEETAKEANQESSTEQPEVNTEESSLNSSEIVETSEVPQNIDLVNPTESIVPDQIIEPTTPINTDSELVDPNDITLKFAFPKF
jgi:hypothetical protein